jgi:anti-sigma regulatory factor (Ser/Thr protein kinase)
LDKDTREHLVKSYAASKSLIYVINDLLDLTRTEAGNDLFRHETFHLPSTIDESVEMFEHDPHRSKLELKVTIQPDFPTVVVGDQVKIRQVVSNVIANAIKHTEKGNVTIEAVLVDKTDDEVQVELSVSDTGSGISPRKLDAIFQNFEQGKFRLNYFLMIVESADTELEQGTGLGLAIVARIVRNMNGQLRAESEVGRGSKFTFAFNFPLPTPAQQAAFLEAATSTPQPNSSQLTYAVPLSPERPNALRRQSNDSLRSRGSTGSARSEIDQLVEMIASPGLEDAPRSTTSRTIKRRSSPNAERGEFNVQDSGVPIRSVRVDEDEVDVPSVGFTVPTSKPTVAFKPQRLHIYVAEDDPVNRAIVRKRLEMDGHRVLLTQNGSEIVDAFKNGWRECDIILMDLQVNTLRGILF